MEQPHSAGHVAPASSPPAPGGYVLAWSCPANGLTYYLSRQSWPNCDCLWTAGRATARVFGSAREAEAERQKQRYPDRHQVIAVEG